MRTMKQAIYLTMILVMLGLAHAIGYPYSIEGQAGANEYVVVDLYDKQLVTQANVDGFYQFNLDTDYQGSRATFKVKGCSQTMALPVKPNLVLNLACSTPGSPLPESNTLPLGPSIAAGVLIAAGATLYYLWRNRKIRCKGFTKAGKPCANYFPCKNHPGLDQYGNLIEVPIPSNLCGKMTSRGTPCKRTRPCPYHPL